MRRRLSIATPGTSRRDVIRLIGTGGLIAAATPMLTACDGMADEAVSGWRPTSESDPRRRALSYALLAPNPHNMQAWAVDLRAPDTIDLYVDRTRLLPRTDPFGRQIVIGHGTFLELLDLAASADGYTTEIGYVPDGDVPVDAPGAEPLVRVRLTQGGRAKDPLFDQVLKRRTNRAGYEDRVVDADTAARLAAAVADPAVTVTVARDGDLPGKLRDIAIKAFDIEMRTPHIHAETVERMRIGADQVAEHRDGLTLIGPLFWWGRRLGLLTHETLADPDSFAFRSGLDMNLDAIAATPAFVWLTTNGNSRRDQIAAGRAYARLNLQATALGLAMQPVSQVLQEYPEMADLQRRFLSTVDAEGRTVQMLARVGYADAPDASPRRPLDDLIVA